MGCKPVGLGDHLSENPVTNTHETPAPYAANLLQTAPGHYERGAQAAIAARDARLSDLTRLYAWLADELRLAREEVAARDAEIAQLRAERWAVVQESALDVGFGDDVRTGGRPELGYALLANARTFDSEAAARDAMRELPVGWVLMPLSRLLPDIGRGGAPEAAHPAETEAQVQEALKTVTDQLRYCAEDGRVCLASVERVESAIRRLVGGHRRPAAVLAQPTTTRPADPSTPPPHDSMEEAQMAARWWPQEAEPATVAAPKSPADLETQRLADASMAGATQWTPMR